MDGASRAPGEPTCTARNRQLVIDAAARLGMALSAPDRSIALLAEGGEIASPCTKSSSRVTPATRRK
jgi:hypothetical protein